MKKLMVMILGKRVFTFLIIAFIIVAGILAYQDLKIDVFPDPSPVLVQLNCEAEGMAPEEVEKFVSYPIETSLYGLPHIQNVTSLSTFGLSAVNVYFDDGIDIHFARQLVAAQLPAIQEKLPDFVDAPELGPITTGLGMVYIYAVTGDLPAVELRTLQDWVIKFQLQTIPGVAAVLSQGGNIKQFQVIVDPQKLIKYKIGLHSVIENIKKSSKNITAGYIVKNNEEYIIRGVGLMEEMEALKKVSIKEAGSTPIFLENVAEIKTGEAVKRGEAMLDGYEIDRCQYC
jgi:cobalt-zinc-cadmium resistance protein CzcA